MIITIKSLVTDLVPIVPVKTVDNAPANLLLAFPHRSLPGLEGKIFRFVKFTKVGNKSSLFTKCLNAAAIDPKRNLFCFLSNDLNSHTMKWSLRNFNIYNEVRSSHFSEINPNFVLSFNKQLYPAPDEDICELKRNQIGSKYDWSSATDHNMWHVWGNLRTVLLSQ